MLSNLDIQHLQPRNRAYFVSDSPGLKVKVLPNGVKKWAVRLSARGRDSLVIIGECSLMPPAEARHICEEMRARNRSGMDALEAIEGAPTFRKIAERWHGQRTENGELSERHLQTITLRLNAYIYPAIGKDLISQITRLQLVDLVQWIAARGTIETAHRVGGILSQVFKYAEDIGALKTGGSLVAAELSRTLKKAHPKHFDTVTQPHEVQAVSKFLKRLRSPAGLCLRFVALTMSRSGEARRATWAEIDFKNALWIVPVEHMKRRRLHKVPLSRQALFILQKMYEKTGGKSDRLIFQGVHSIRNSKNVALTDAALLKLLKEGTGAGDIPPLSVHGLRSMASTILNEKHFDKEIIEMQLSHLDKDRIRAIYNNSERLEERREMLQFYADFLDDIALNDSDQEKTQ